jgi:L-amino acid N-acyltransferase YncA
MKPTIRIAKPEDAHALAEVHTLSWQSTYRGIVSDDYLDYLDIDKKAEWWAQALTKGGLVYVAETDRIIGFASGGKNRDIKSPYQGELYAIYLLPHCKEKGTGTMLFESVIRLLHSENINSMMVWVLKDNPSKNFYIKMGGVLYTEEEITLGDQTLIEEAYGWSDLKAHQ